MTLREKVARAIDPFAWDERFEPAPSLEQARQDSLCQADAAVSTVLEAMREPSDEICELGALKIIAKELETEGRRKLTVRGWVAFHVYRAMLSAFAREAGVDTDNRKE